MLLLIFLEISIAFVLKLYSLNVIKKSRIDRELGIEIESNRDNWIDTQP